jgi:hypothetical protein
MRLRIRTVIGSTTGAKTIPSRAIEYVESGRFAEDEPMVLNLFIQNPETGEWE